MYTGDKMADEKKIKGTLNFEQDYDCVKISIEDSKMIDGQEYSTSFDSLEKLRNLHGKFIEITITVK